MKTSRSFPQQSSSFTPEHGAGAAGGAERLVAYNRIKPARCTVLYRTYSLDTRPYTLPPEWLISFRGASRAERHLLRTVSFTSLHTLADMLMGFSKFGKCPTSRRFWIRLPKEMFRKVALMGCAVEPGNHVHDYTT